MDALSELLSADGSALFGYVVISIVAVLVKRHLAKPLAWPLIAGFALVTSVLFYAIFGARGWTHPALAATVYGVTAFLAIALSPRFAALIR